jgi:hypothetical protein
MIPVLQGEGEEEEEEVVVEIGGGGFKLVSASSVH